MKRWEAIDRIINWVESAAVIHANGMIRRESYASRDRPENFYMLGSMGLASCIGLGLALEQPDRRVVVLDGDGNILMGLGSLAMVGAYQPRNLIHVVLDNEVYASTGDQPTLSSRIYLDDIARASGYRHIVKAVTLPDVETIFRELMALDGPSFFLIKVEPGNMTAVPRVVIQPDVISRRFKEAIYVG